MNVRVEWYEHDCEYISKYCDEHHTRTASVPLAYLQDPGAYERHLLERAWDEGYMAVPAEPEDREFFVEDAPNPYRSET